MSLLTGKDINNVMKKTSLLTLVLFFALLTQILLQIVY